MSELKSWRSRLTDSHYKNPTIKLQHAISDYRTAKTSPEFVEDFGDADVFLHDLLIFAERWLHDRNQKQNAAYHRAEAKKMVKASAHP